MKIFFKILFVLIIVMFLDVLRYVIYPNVSSLKKNNPELTAFMEYREAQWADENKDMKIDKNK